MLCLADKARAQISLQLSRQLLAVHGSYSVQHEKRLTGVFKKSSRVLMTIHSAMAIAFRPFLYMSSRFFFVPASAGELLLKSCASCKVSARVKFLSVSVQVCQGQGFRGCPTWASKKLLVK